MLTLQDGSAVTLETASVKGHTVLGTSVGQTIVRVDVDAAAIPASASGTAGVAKNPLVDQTGFGDLKIPGLDNTGWSDVKNPVLDNTGWQDNTAAWLDRGTGFWRDKHPIDDDATNPGGRFPD